LLSLFKFPFPGPTRTAVTGPQPSGASFRSRVFSFFPSPSPSFSSSSSSSVTVTVAAVRCGAGESESVTAVFGDLESVTVFGGSPTQSPGLGLRVAGSFAFKCTALRLHPPPGRPGAQAGPDPGPGPLTSDPWHRIVYRFLTFLYPGFKTGHKCNCPIFYHIVQYETV
jgi:hypothetical protein